MPIYEYSCWRCEWQGERLVPHIEDRDQQTCERCGTKLALRLSAPYGRVIGRADGKVVGGPDQFTADVFGYKRVDDLPVHLRADKGEKK